MTFEIRQGDALALLRAMPEASVQTVVTSPPYWGLRDYGTATWEGGDLECAHKGRPKPRQDTSGGGPTKGRFAETRGTQAAKAIHSIPVRAVCGCGARRIDAQIGLESSPADYVARLVEVFREVRRVMRTDGTLWLNIGDGYCASPPGNAPRDLSRGRPMGTRGRQPSKKARAVRVNRVFGLKQKDLVGMPWRVAFALQEDGWWLRSDIIWHKPNPMPESIKDRPTKAHEYLFLLAAGERYVYDAGAVLEPTVSLDPEHSSYRPNSARIAEDGRKEFSAKHVMSARAYDAAGRNRRSVWTVTTVPYADAHFATFPQALVEPCILAGTGVGATVLDPFCGAGTVGVVALRHGRRFLGLELNPEYVAMARRRIAGPLFADHHDTEPKEETP